MPDLQTPDKMHLSKDQLDRATRFLNEKWKSAPCPMCRTSKWIIGGHVVVMRAAPPEAVGNLVVGGPVYPLLPVTCTNCAHTVFVNVMLMDGGILPKAKEDADGG